MIVGICAIIKDCYEPYLREWVEYHRALGVDKFFIFDNESAVPISSILSGDDIQVEVVKGRAMQMPCYDRILNDMHLGRIPLVDRLAFIDEDEFIVCENGSIKETLEKYRYHSGIGINWRTFGSSGLLNKTPEPQRAKFVMYTRPSFKMNRHIKSIVDPSRASSTRGNPHAFVYMQGECVDVMGNRIVGAFSNPVHKIMWIDHYYTRSREEWDEKIGKGRADTDIGERPYDLFDEVDAYSVEKIGQVSEKEKQIHLITPFYRKENKERLVNAYRPMGIEWHPILFEDEEIDFGGEPWIHPVVIPMKADQCPAAVPGTYKRNYWIETQPIVDGDYYVTVDDDDMYEPGVFDAIRQMNDDIVVISLKRGYALPTEIHPARRYPTDTLRAKPEYVVVGAISGQQMFVKGNIFRQHPFDDSSHVWDGKMAEHYRDSGEQMRFEPNLYGQFNFYEPGRWDVTKRMAIGFGCLVNDLMRLDMVLRQSEFPHDFYCHTIKLPETATKGLNTLLGIMEDAGDDIAILVHQDMYFRSGWIDQVRGQIKKLPESWVVAGIIGKDMEGEICGRVHDMRIPLHFSTSHEFPHEASCFDECCIIVNLKKGFRFDEGLPGFDLYGTLCVLQTWEMGGTAWILDAFAEHYCMRSFSWYPDKAFESCFKWLYDRFPNARKIESTVMGVPRKAAKA